MQRQANLDFVEGRKKAYSPPPGGSMHEAGRAMDIDLASIGVSLSQFWETAKARGFSPIIDAPIPSRSESWHFDCRGSHGAVYRYVQEGKAGSSIPPYTQMAHSAILAIGVQVDALPDQSVGYPQLPIVTLTIRIASLPLPIVSLQSGLQNAGRAKSPSGVSLPAFVYTRLTGGEAALPAIPKWPPKQL